MLLALIVDIFCGSFPSYGLAFGSLCPDWRTLTVLYSLSSKYEGGSLLDFDVPTMLCRHMLNLDLYICMYVCINAFFNI